jgi:hypothetical protein
VNASVYGSDKLLTSRWALEPRAWLLYLETLATHLDLESNYARGSFGLAVNGPPSARKA